MTTCHCSNVDQLLIEFSFKWLLQKMTPTSRRIPRNPFDIPEAKYILIIVKLLSKKRLNGGSGKTHPNIGRVQLLGCLRQMESLRLEPVLICGVFHLEFLTIRSEVTVDAFYSQLRVFALYLVHSGFFFPFLSVTRLITARQTIQEQQFENKYLRQELTQSGNCHL